MTEEVWKQLINFSIGQKVKFAVGDQQGIITGICIRRGTTFYLVTWAHDLGEKWHSDFELELIQEPKQPPGFKT